MSHADAAELASEHLDAAVEAVEGTYDHPYHAERVKAIKAHIANIKGWLATMPGDEESRADHAKRVMEGYRNRTLGPVIPEHDDRMLGWELERAGK